MDNKQNIRYNDRELELILLGLWSQIREHEKENPLDCTRLRAKKKEIVEELLDLKNKIRGFDVTQDVYKTHRDLVNAPNGVYQVTFDDDTHETCVLFNDHTETRYLMCHKWLTPRVFANVKIMKRIAE